MNPAQDLVMDTGKIRRQLGYKECFPMDDGLAEVIQWDLVRKPQSDGERDTRA
jgi:nucleoside-diphosphate-sugar epimerase